MTGIPLTDDIDSPTCTCGYETNRIGDPPWSVHVCPDLNCAVHGIAANPKETP